MPELIQDNADPGKICRTAFSMLETLDIHKQNLAEVRRRLGSPGAPERTAKIIRYLTNPDKTD